MRDAEDDAGLLHDLGQLLGLGEVEGHRLVAHDVEAGLGEGFGDLKMGIVRRGDGNEVDALVGRQLLFALDHLLVGAVGAFGANVVVGGGGLGLGGVGRQGAGDEGGAVVHDGGDAVDAADEGALAAADQAHAELAVQGCVDAHAMLSFRDDPGGNVWCPL